MTDAFPRCTVTRSDGARCWRPPHAEGRHVCLKPGEIPSASSIRTVMDLHPEGSSKGYIGMLAALEPVGKGDTKSMAQAANLIRNGFR